MEIKWIALGFAVVMTALSADHAISQNSKNQCKQIYAASNRTAEDIIKICGH